MDLSQVTLRNFATYLSEDVASAMQRMNILKKPVLTALEDDAGILDEIYYKRVVDPVLSKMADGEPHRYLAVIGCHALGAAAYVTLTQRYYGKRISQYGEEELREVADALAKGNVYELGLNALGFRPDGNNRKCLDEIILVAADTAIRLAGSRINDLKYVRAYMQVLYNAGVSLVSSASPAEN